MKLQVHAPTRVETVVADEFAKGLLNGEVGELTISAKLHFGLEYKADVPCKLVYTEDRLSLDLEIPPHIQVSPDAAVFVPMLAMLNRYDGYTGIPYVFSNRVRSTDCVGRACIVPPGNVINVMVCPNQDYETYYDSICENLLDVLATIPEPHGLNDD